LRYTPQVGLLEPPRLQPKHFCQSVKALLPE
jgi:hypothetical protein